MKIHVDVDKCIAAGHCVKAAPQLFVQDDDTGLIVVIGEIKTEADKAAALKASRLCPALVITLSDDEAAAPAGD